MIDIDYVKENIDLNGFLVHPNIIPLFHTFWESHAEIKIPQGFLQILKKRDNIRVEKEYYLKG